MNRRSFWSVLLGVALVALVGLPSRGEAGVNVAISVNGPPLPAYVVPAPPSVIPIPGTYVYCAPDVGVDMLFYGGFWYRPHGGHWYRARSYNGPWAWISPARVPHAVVALPPDYRGMVHGHDRVPYGQLKKNWARWERERYWDSRPEWRGRAPRPREERGWDHARKEQGKERGGGERARGQRPGGEDAWEQHGPGSHGNRGGR